jgi:hypothetical protein
LGRFGDGNDLAVTLISIVPEPPSLFLVASMLPLVLQRQWRAKIQKRFRNVAS